MTRKQIELAGKNAVKRLRESKLKNGVPFMINTQNLPSEQCYLEYPDGSIELVKLSGDKMDFVVIRKLTIRQVQVLRKKYKLPEFVSMNFGKRQ